MLTRRYGLAPGVALGLLAGRPVLRCRFPLRIVTLNATAARVLAAFDGTSELHALVEAPTPALLGLLEGLVAEGVLRCDYGLVPPTHPPRVRVVIPAFGNVEGLQRCLAGLAEQSYPAERFEVVVVDDASPRPLQGAVAVPPGLAERVNWARLAVNSGAATARNVGAGVAPGTVFPAGGSPPDLLAFVDSDCVPGPDWLGGLAALLEGPWVSAGGGRVAGLLRGRLLARYEAACASLYMGERATPVGLPGSRAPYLPACNLGVSWEAFAAVGGFRPQRRVGEDVDLCWRLAAGGGGVFYFPAPEVRHRYRERWGPFLLRKGVYAFSEAWLRRAHPARFARPGGRAPRAALLLAAGCMAAGAWPWLPAAISLPWLEGLARLRGFRGGSAGFSLPDQAAAWARRGAGGMVGEARTLGRTTLVFWPLGLAFFPGVWPLAVGVLLLGGWGEWRARRPALRVWEFATCLLGEWLAYSAGKVAGMVFGWREPFARWLGLNGAWRGVAPPAERETGTEKQ